MKSLILVIALFFSLSAQADTNSRCEFLYKEYGRLRSALDWSKNLPDGERAEFLQTSKYDDLVSTTATIQTLLDSSSCRFQTSEDVVNIVDASLSFTQQIRGAFLRALANHQRLQRNLPIVEGLVLEQISEEQIEL